MAGVLFLAAAGATAVETVMPARDKSEPQGLLGKDRQVRVFISSTFRDMHAERDHLVTVVFPELRERVEQLGLEFFDVDLRWGVPAKTLDGETANSWEYCRQWIDRVEPFFVCILGQRYGWVPKVEDFKSDVDKARQAAEPRSITDLEVRHAVLNDRRKRRSYFYLRGTLVPELPPNATAKECKLYAEFVDPEPEAGKLTALKNDVKQCKRPARGYECRWTGKEFADLDKAEKKFGPMVLEDLWSGVLRDDRYVSKDVWRQVLGGDPDSDPRYTDESEPVARELWEKIVALARPAPVSPLDAERQQMDAFAASRLRWFQGRTCELQQLTDFIQSTAPDAPHLAVVAAVPGQGKSALLAKLHQQLSELPQEGTKSTKTFAPSAPLRGQSLFLITHFVGATERSATAHALVERLLGELDRSGIQWPADERKEGEEPKRDFNSLCERLRKRLGDYAGESRVVILLDALNQLTDGHDLHWLPVRLGPSVRVVVSCVDDSLTRPGGHPLPSDGRGAGGEGSTLEQRVLHALASRQPAPLRVPLGRLTETDVRTIVVEYLEEYCHELDREHLDTLCAIPQTRNPLYLLVMLNELRTLGGNDLNVIVPARIASMSQDYPDTVALFRWVLQRLEVFGAEAVRWWCLYLAHGRVGMASSELAELLARKLPSEIGTDIPTTPSNRPQVSDPAATALLIERGLRRYLLRRGGQLDFFHSQLRQAVMAQYGAHAEATVVHHELAFYFRGFADSESNGTWLGGGRRPFEELPYHLTGAGHLQELRTILSDLAYLDARVLLSGPMSLLSDYMIVPVEEATSTEAWRAFLLRHASTLRMVPSVLPSLAWYAGPPEVRQSAEAYVRLGKHRHSWLKLDSLPPVRPPIQESVHLNLETPSFEILCRCDEIRATVAAVAPAFGVGFYLKQLGHIGVIDFEMGVVSDFDVPYPPMGRPLTMSASDDGRWVSLVDDAGKGLCLELHWLQGERYHPVVASQKVFTCLLPELENPAILFACGHLWWQDSSGYIAFWKLGMPNIARCTQLRGELRSLCVVSDEIIALDVSGEDSSLVVIDSNGTPRRRIALPRRMERLCTYSKCGAILLASNGRTSILPTLSDELVNGPMMAGAIIKMFPLMAGVCFVTPTQSYFCSGNPNAGSVPCETFRNFLAFAEDDDFLYVIGEVGAFRATRPRGAVRNVVTNAYTHALCPHFPGTGYSALLEADGTLYTSEPEPQQVHTHGRAEAASARNAVANTGQLVWPETPNHMALWTPPNPPVLTKINGIGAVLFVAAGKQGEYWLVNDENDIWGMNAQGQGRKLASVERRITRPSPHGLVIGNQWLAWYGTSMGDDKRQSPDPLDTLIVFEVKGDVGNRRLVQAGHHFFEPDNGKWMLTLWNAAAGEFACFFQLLGERRFFARVGSPAAILRGRERRIDMTLPEILARELEAGTPFANGQAWLVRTRTGWLTALELGTLQMLGAYPAAITSVIASQVGRNGDCLASLADGEVVRCSLHRKDNTSEPTRNRSAEQ